MILTTSSIFPRLYILSLLLLCSGWASGQQIEHPRLFMNCNTRCYADYIQNELSFFDFVRDRFVCDVEILVNGLPTGAGGFEYTLLFYGQNSFSGKTAKVVFLARLGDTEDIIRKELVKAVKLGMVQLLLDTEMMQLVNINFPRRESIKVTTPTKDKWDNWVFNIRGNGSVRAEANKSNSALNGVFTINRITSRSKYSLYSYHNQYFDRFRVEDEFVRGKRVEYGVSSLYVKSFSEHWSAGAFYRGYHSLYQNIRFNHRAAPALEYSVFPISRIMQKQLRFVYQAGMRRLNYIETTIFDKIEETLPYQQLTGIMGITEPWGSFKAELNAFQYLHDLSKNSVSLAVDLNWRVMQGLMVNFHSDFSLINNQISLAKGEGDASQILLNNRMLATNYRYGTSFGLNYTFGSINNTAINPRFSGVN